MGKGGEGSVSVQRACAVCGVEFTAQRSTRRYCGSGCRAKAAEAGGLHALESARAARAVLPVVSGGGVRAAVCAELTGAGMLDSALGQMAVRLAVEVDAGDTPAAAKAGLVKQLREVHAAALASGVREVTAQDAILARVVGKLRSVSSA